MAVMFEPWQELLEFNDVSGRVGQFRGVFLPLLRATFMAFIRAASVLGRLRYGMAKGKIGLFVVNKTVVVMRI